MVQNYAGSLTTAPVEVFPSNLASFIYRVGIKHFKNQGRQPHYELDCIQDLE